jgi:hypothetical protein
MTASFVGDNVPVKGSDNRRVLDPQNMPYVKIGIEVYSGDINIV